MPTWGVEPTLDVIYKWPKPNYVNPVTQGPAVDACVYITTIAMILFVVARFYVRMNSKGGLQLDDWFLLVGAVFGLALSVLLVTMTKHIIGRHLYDIEAWRFPTFKKLNLLGLALYNGCCTFTKISVCMTYLHLFPSKTNRVFSWTMIIYQTLWGIITTVLYMLQCMPVRAIWDATIFHKKCLDGHTLLTAIGALNVVSDFLIFLWPVKPLWQIKLPLSQRIHLISVFSLGVLTCIGGILKLIWGQQYFQSWDILWIAARCSIAICIEYNVGLMGACLPCLPPLMAMLLPKYFGKASQAKGSSYAAHSGNASWRKFKSPFNSKNVNSIKLASDPPSDFTHSYEYAERKPAGALRTWTAADHDPEAAIKPGTGLQVIELADVEQRESASLGAGNDSSSETWIMDENKSTR